MAEREAGLGPMEMTFKIALGASPIIAIIAIMLPAQPNQSLMDGLACLQHLASRGESLACADLARELGLETTRANRLLRTLAHLGLAEQDEKRRYRPGPAIHVLAAQALFGSGLLRTAMPYLEDLRQFKCVVAMGVLWRDKVCYLYHASPRTPQGEALGRVGLFPVIQSGIGCALLAAEEDAQVRQRLKGLSDPAGIRSLLTKLNAFRQTGVAVVPQEHHKDVVSYGVAIGDRPAAAIGLSGQLSASVQSQAIGALQHVADAIASAKPFQPFFSNHSSEENRR